ncbi:MAG: class I SAM-dependent methyltransferase [Pelatocladus maniniholoensis HA4357-MV3]|jgi:SAM-dependent methyltransferase|uniref:Class I SAM-dependent methyltransferase n=1 Tax=Pelatocladus maniniholoensis HA4357-MV3 TaxID=1117104 RepID=A0A9E3HAC2_9NOST|nr:class I SAM-dependent methyltransferase [Pelatocladus maniniholoensis HA4357-MV3]BAZ65280.1 type 12 methyltransferase [Fischerella sp. NIES-4106]
MVSPNEIEIKLYEAYDASYQVFLKNWQVNRQVALDLMQKHLNPQPPQVAVLSVGAGPGDFDVQVIDTLKQKISKEFKLRYVAVEPNHLHRQRYEQKINPSDFADVDLKVHPEKIEEFWTDEKFDIIHYTHSMYHMPDHEQQLVQKAMEMLKENGFLLLTLDTRDAVIFDTIFKYAALTGEGFTDMLQMEKMQEIVDNLGLSYEVVNYPEYMDVTLCFEENSSAGKALMDFFCQSDSSQLSDEQRQEMLHLLASNISEKDGKKLVPLPAATMVICK